jgi:3-oxoacyl-[acyl-carrier protein] reductase
MIIDLSSKKALIFGASSGIGFAVAKSLYESKAQVAVNAREGEKLRALPLKLPQAALFAGDLSLSATAAKVTADALKHYDGLDILVLNTGGPPAGSFESTSLDLWQTYFQSLYLSAVESIQVGLPHMKQQKFGRIILIASSSAREPIPNLTLSNGLRSGLLGMMKSLSNEVAEYGITVNTILPGYINTDRLRQLGRNLEDITKQIPAKRLGEASEVASLVTFLCSDHAGYITGQAINIDGGKQKSL